MNRRQRQRFLGIAASAVALAGLSSAVSAQTTVGVYTGPEDLDLAGTFAYALDVGGNDGSLTVGGLTFTDDSATPGVVGSSEFDDFEYQTATDYGATADDQNLEMIASTIRWTQFDGSGPATTVTLDLDVTPGTAYKLQLLFQDDARGAGGRGFDVLADGATIADNFGSSSGDLTSGRLITHEFTSGDSTLNLVFDGPAAAGAGFGDLNAIVSGLTLEVVPEPGSLTLVALGGLPLALRRRRRA
jgi:hypothetical protein